MPPGVFTDEDPHVFTSSDNWRLLCVIKWDCYFQCSGIWDAMAILGFHLVIHINDYVFDTSNVELELVTPAYYGTDSASSTPYLLPAFQSGLDLFRERFPQFNVSHTFLWDAEAPNCTVQQYNVRELLAKWYYSRQTSTTVPVIYGSGCIEGCEINMMAREWNIMMMLTASPIPDNSDHIYQSFLQRFNWTTVVAVHDETSIPVYGLVARFIPIVRKKPDFNATYWSFSSMRDIARVNIILQALKEITRADHNMTNGDYVFIAYQLFSNRSYGNFSWQFFDKDDEKARRAFRTVFKVNGIYRDPEQAYLLDKWLPLWRNSTPLPDPMLASINSSDRASLQNGTFLASQFFNRSFAVDVGNITFNSVTMREICASILQFNEVSERLETIMYAFQAREINAYPDWNVVRNLTWFGGYTFPPNEPRCGYKGDRHFCRVESHLTQPISFGIVITVVVFSSVCYIAFLIHRRYNIDPTWYSLELGQLVLPECVPWVSWMSIAKSILLSRPLPKRLLK
ncbi:hypothetical protein BV898_15335 [Hypsibius exemplaris]|uniref:Receptor ligand binding region domain-containing protein n=1 Tax=Hypsibius exemplaris TaxID=2072580 RepID=A0A9X6NBD6_HYPEX|nr:hypothetical protein BV898_15335 [Hypsibius exemplaris]